ncbi:FAD-dependent oxidoreductase [Geodermatophilus ruber]|uniref:6-hydroxy-3-succinoylpyridine 3-monooxygenase n=1 Tax=Geodermatophilus ruber TaxID=504800 RepID=A0A1I4FJL6_9ACTN|nr:FAD-dependent monooxygenase [Geodermatophilus ruber]SFL17659.1 6-hydroxy-3-succinoylpyridine 3-monooxygenase [Geodermatophilus ruber]
MIDDTVLVVGAGPVGILNALGLARAGIPVTVLDRADDVVMAPRAAVYHWAVLEGLDRLGVYEKAAARGFLKQDYEYRAHRTGERVRFGLEPLDGIVARPYNLHLGQGDLVRLALEELAAHDSATVLWQHTVVGVAQDESGVTVAVDAPGGRRELRAGWLIGADGAHSAVRRALGIEFEGFTWPERFVATNVRYPFQQHGFAQTSFVCDDVYGAVIAKLDESPGGGLWRYTYCEDVALPEEAILDRMPGFFAAVLPDLDGFELVEHAPYRMHQRCATRFRDGRVLLAGDAAHVTNPAGGLGLTGGLFDTFVLQEALAAVIRGEADGSVLDAYARERRRVFLEMVNPAATAIKKMIFHSSDPQQLERDMAGLRRLATDREALIERLMVTKAMETKSLIGAW